MKKFLMVLVLFLLTLMSAVILSANQAIQPISEFYVFGDSLSDTGTVFRATNGLYPSDPPYFRGRYSNGRVWVEYLAEQLAVKQVRNVACGGATSGTSGNNPVPGLISQVQTFVQNNPRANPHALYILWAGANDYLQGVTNTNLPVANIIKSVEVLARSGATQVLIGNLPDLGQLPATRLGANASALSQLTQSHNLGLQRSLKGLQQQYLDLQIVTLDAYSLYHQAIAQPAQFGFTQVTNACLSGGSSCRQPEQFLFWDSIHPTTAGHRILAESSAAALRAQLSLPQAS